MTKIMLVEDDKSLREIYGVRLLAEGYEIISAGDGEEALAMAVKEKPGLIISDVMMPKISGFDMLDILRATPETKGIKVIMMTALSSDDQRERGETLGADKYLVKSQVGIEDVVRTIHEVLGDVPIAAAAPRFDTTPPVIEPTPAPAPVPAEPVVAPQTAPLVEPVISTLPPQPTSYATDPVVVAPVPGAPEPVVSAPQPVVATPVPVVPEPVVITPTPVLPEPVVAATAPQPVATPPLAPSTAPVAPVLPQPTAPFSTPAPTSLGERVINPPAAPTEHQNIGMMMEKELTNPVAVSAAQPVAVQPVVPQPMVTPTPDLSAQMVQELNDGSNTAPTPPPQF